MALYDKETIEFPVAMVEELALYDADTLGVPVSDTDAFEAMYDEEALKLMVVVP